MTIMAQIVRYHERGEYGPMMTIITDWLGRSRADAAFANVQKEIQAHLIVARCRNWALAYGALDRLADGLRALRAANRAELLKQGARLIASEMESARLHGDDALVTRLGLLGMTVLEDLKPEALAFRAVYRSVFEQR